MNKMDKKTLVIIAIILIVLVGSLIYFSFSNKVDSPEDMGNSVDSSGPSESQDNQIPPPPALP